MSQIRILAGEAPKDPHLCGDARCLACQHRWVAVAPTGTIWLECPKCSLKRGRFVAQVQRDGPHWHCECGNDLFYMTPVDCYCCNCGLSQKGF